jgi:SPP1 gp7 family putative phage head morphogenesis protein
VSRIEGPTRRTIARREQEYGARFVASIRDTLRAVTSGFSGVVTLDDLAAITREWNRRVDAGLLEDIGQAYADAAYATRVSQRDALVELLKANGTLLAAAGGDTFEIPSVANQRAEDVMGDARNRLTNVGNEVWENARGELLTGLQNGEGIPQLRDRVMGATDLTAARAETIARTEIASAMNSGALDQMRQIDAPGMTKEFIATDDGRTRPEHLAQNGEKVPLNGAFSNGIEPGDEPNCRCTYGFDIPNEQLVDSACSCGEDETALLASVALTAGIDLGDDLGAVCACGTEPAEPFAAQEVWDTILAMARDKIETAPIPSEEAIAKAQAELEKAKKGLGRAGGDSRGGSAAARRKQRLNLFKEFGGEERGYVPCHGCGTKTHWADPGSADNPHGYPRFERGKIFVKCQGGGYQLLNLLPECFACNRSRNDKMVRRENAC